MEMETVRKLVKTLLILKEKVKCAICLDVVRDVTELDCNHRYCSNCLNELKSSEKNPLCPLCKKPIKKRCTIYKDVFTDRLSNFVSEACNVIKAEYGCEVEILDKDRNAFKALNTDELNARTKKASETVNTKNTNELDVVPSTFTPNLPKDAFDQLLSSSNIRTYKNQTKKNVYQQRILHRFEDQNNKHRVIDWLNSNETRFNKVTHSQKSNENHLFDEDILDLPSISQVPPRTRYKLRSHSLDIETRKVSQAPLKKYKSLNSNLNDEDYTIEEINTEKIERNVIQDLLEDACLANMEVDNKNKKQTVPKRKSKSVKGLKQKMPSSVDSSNNGWDRIKNVKNSIQKIAKAPKQLNITLRSTSPQQNNSKKASHQYKTRTGTKTKADKVKRAEGQEQGLAEKNREVQCFNLSVVEDYLSTNIQNICVQDILSTSADAIIDDQSAKIKHLSVIIEKPNLKENPVIENDNINNDIILMPTHKSVEKPHDTVTEHIKINGNSAKEKSDQKNMFEKPNLKENTTVKKHKINNDIFLMPTQKTVEKAHDAITEHIQISENNVNEKSDQKSMFLIPTQKAREYLQTNEPTHAKLPIIPEIPFVDQGSKSLEHIIDDLQDKVDSYISLVSYETDAVSKGLLSCFINLKLYVEKIKHVSCQKVEQMSKSVQTVERLKQSVQTQTVVCTSIEKAVQTEKVEVRLDKDNSEKIFDEIKDNIEFTNYASKAEDFYPKVKNLPQTRSTHESVNKIQDGSCGSNKSQEISNKSLSRRKSNISTAPKPAEPSNSLLIFSLDNTAPPESKKINRKLTFNETQNKRFKRIRLANSDSDSDEEHCKKKTRNRFLRDDLSIHFTETALPDPNIDSQLHNSDANNTAYDKYLDEVLKKYDSPKHSPEKKASNHNTPEINDDDLNAICDKLVSQVRNRDDKHVTQKTQQKNKLCQVENLAPPKQVDEFDHIFSGDHIFSDPEVIRKFDKDISQFNRNFKEKNSVDESIDVIENSVFCSGPVLKKAKLEKEIVNSQNQKPVERHNSNSESLFANNRHSLQDQKNVSQEKVNDNDIFGNDDLDEEFALISFTEVERQAELNKNQEKINILQNVKIKSQDKCKDLVTSQKEVVEIVDSNDELFSDDDVVETTPQKNRDKVRSVMTTNIDALDTSFKIPTSVNGLSAGEDLHFDVCLPPPPGFGDDSDTNNSENDHTVIENTTAKFLNKSSLTPDRLSQIVENPIEISKPKVIKSQISETENSPVVSVHNDSSLITPKRGAISKVNLSLAHSTPRSQSINRDTLGFSPINEEKSSPTFREQPNLIEIAHNSKYTPLVTTKKIQPKKNIMTSVPNQKSILNYVRPSQENKPVKKPCVAYTRILSKNEAIVSRLKAADLINISTTFGPHVTHMVVLVDERGCVKAHTAKYVLAVAAGIWVVRFEWIEACLRSRCILPEEPYEAVDLSGLPGPKMSRMTRISAPLLRGFKFYCALPFSNISIEDAENAIKMLGGQIVAELKELAQNEKSTNLIITDTTATDDTEMFECWLKKYKAVTVDVEWLTKSIGQYKTISVRPYVLCSDDSICDLGYPTHLIESVPFTFSENL